eukprot:5417048-Amphidinium_carterae.1
MDCIPQSPKSFPIAWHASMTIGATYCWRFTSARPRYLQAGTQKRGHKTWTRSFDPTEVLGDALKHSVQCT